MTSIFWFIVKVVGVFIVIRLMSILMEPNRTWIPEDERYAEDTGDERGPFILGAILVFVVVFATPEAFGELDLVGSLLCATIAHYTLPRFITTKED